MYPNLSRRDEVALRGARERQLLLGDHHHPGSGWVDVSRSNRSSATTCLYPRSTGGHGRSVLIITLENRWGGKMEGKKDEEFMLAKATCSVWACSAFTIAILTHVLECNSIFACVGVCLITHSLSSMQCFHSKWGHRFSGAVYSKLLLG